MIPCLGQDIYKIILGYFIIPKNKEAAKDYKVGKAFGPAIRPAGTLADCIKVCGIKFRRCFQSSFLLLCILGGSSDGLSIWLLVSHVGESARVLISWLQPGPLLPVASISEAKQRKEHMNLSVFCLSTSPSLSLTEIIISKDYKSTSRLVST